MNEQQNAVPENTEEQEQTRRIICGPKYREIYRERGNPNHCGDWLAETLNGEFSTVQDDTIKFDTVAFEECLRENGVPMDGKWAKLPESGQRGWQGRYRMNGRQKLEIEVTRNRKLKLKGKNKRVPKEWLDAMLDKHNKLLEVKK